MPIKHHEKGRYRRLPLARALIAINLMFAVIVLTGWQLALQLVLGPITWAADRPMPNGHEFWTLFQYPLLAFWAGPTCAVLAGRLLIEARNYKAAFGILALPVLITVLTLVLYVTVPNALS